MQKLFFPILGLSIICGSTAQAVNDLQNSFSTNSLVVPQRAPQPVATPAPAPVPTPPPRPAPAPEPQIQTSSLPAEVTTSRPSEIVNSSLWMSSPNLTAPPFGTPPARPAAPATPATMNVNARVSYPGTSYAGQQRAALLTSCGTLSFGEGTTCVPLQVASDFIPFLTTNIPKCVNEALRAEGQSAASSIFVEHMGAFKNRNVRGSSTVSLHAAGRAIDISRFRIRTQSGSNVNIPMTVASRNRQFYKTFNTCWKRVNAERANCGGRHAGLIDCSDADHRDHVHASMPFCPRKSGIAGT